MTSAELRQQAKLLQNLAADVSTPVGMRAVYLETAQEWELRAKRADRASAALTSNRT